MHISPFIELTIAVNALEWVVDIETDRIQFIRTAKNSFSTKTIGDYAISENLFIFLGTAFVEISKDAQANRWQSRVNVIIEKDSVSIKANNGELQGNIQRGNMLWTFQSSDSSLEKRYADFLDHPDLRYLMDEFGLSTYAEVA